MGDGAGPGSAAVELSEEVRRRLVSDLRGIFRGEFDRELSEYQANRLLERMIEGIGPAVYNRAVADCAAYMTEAVSDLQAVLHAGDPGSFRTGSSGGGG
jgi:uncharacterized protein (DUF2164 family)